MKAGDKVVVMGVRSRERVYCDDPDCELEHVDRDGPRRHYIDGPREGIPGVFVDYEPVAYPSRTRKLVVETADGNTVSVDAADVEAAS